MKRLTKNRIDILRCLTTGHHDCGLPPYSVSTIHYMLYFYEFDENGVGKFANVSKERKKTQMNQIRRTLEEMAMEGIVVISRRKNWDTGTALPFWEKEYQISEMVEVNYFDAELQSIERKISNAYNGFGTLFGGKPDGEGLSQEEKDRLTKKVKSLIQKTHPDKVIGKEHIFRSMKKCLDMLREMPVKK